MRAVNVKRIKIPFGRSAIVLRAKEKQPNRNWIFVLRIFAVTEFVANKIERVTQQRWLPHWWNVVDLVCWQNGKVQFVWYQPHQRRTKHPSQSHWHHKWAKRWRILALKPLKNQRIGWAMVSVGQTEKRIVN